MEILGMIAESGTPQAGVTAVGLSGTLLLIGTFLKNRTRISNEHIPLILVILAVPSYIAMVWPVDFNSIVMAVGAAFSAVGMYESGRDTKAAKKVKTILNLKKPQK